jgi:hypothetical protein
MREWRKCKGSLRRTSNDLCLQLFVYKPTQCRNVYSVYADTRIGFVLLIHFALKCVPWDRCWCSSSEDAGGGSLELRQMAANVLIMQLPTGNKAMTFLGTSETPRQNEVLCDEITCRESDCDSLLELSQILMRIRKEFKFKWKISNSLCSLRIHNNKIRTFTAVKNSKHTHRFSNQ